MLIWIDENKTFKKHLWHGMASHLRYKMAEGHITFVMLFLGLFQSWIVFLEISVSLLNVQS